MQRRVTNYTDAQETEETNGGLEFAQIGQR